MVNLIQINEVIKIKVSAKRYLPVRDLLFHLQFLMDLCAQIDLQIEMFFLQRALLIFDPTYIR